MGYRCPKCHMDFGFDREKLDEHLANSPTCAVEAYVNTELWKVSVGIKKPRYSYRSTDREPRTTRSYSHVADTHVWVKQNLVSNDDGSDTVVCKRCGLKAKRIYGRLEFDMRYTRKIENCID